MMNWIEIFLQNTKNAKYNLTLKHNECSICCRVKNKAYLRDLSPIQLVPSFKYAKPLPYEEALVKK